MLVIFQQASDSIKPAGVLSISRNKTSKTNNIVSFDSFCTTSWEELEWFDKTEEFNDRNPKILPFIVPDYVCDCPVLYIFNSK